MEQKKIKIKSIYLLFPLLAVAVAISYLVTESQKNSELLEINEKVDAVFQGKNEICDYEISGVTGNSFEVTGFSALTAPKDNEGKSLNEIYNCKEGGWTVINLKRVNNGFEYIESDSKDMGFKVPESETHSFDNGDFTYPTTYNTPTYRGTVQNAYQSSVEFITSEKPNKGYSAGVFSKLQAFSELQSKFYYINNIEPTDFSNETVNEKSWRKEQQYIFNKNWIVWYYSVGKHYEITLDDTSYYKTLAVNSGIAVIISLLLFFVWMKRPKFEIVK